MNSFLDVDVALYDNDLAALDALSDESPPLGEHIERVKRCVSPPRRRATRRFSWLLGGVGFAMASAIVAIAVLTPSERTRVKGAIEIRIHHKRDGRTVVWDRVSALRPGTPIQIEIAGMGTGVRPVAVDVRVDSGWSPLYRGAIEGPRGLIHQGWEVDGVRPQEELCIRLGAVNGPLPPAPKDRCEAFQLEISVR
ncbi:MAG: hypothetical protein AAFY60_11015 [Myxococcota bacterium]